MLFGHLSLIFRFVLWILIIILLTLMISLIVRNKFSMKKAWGKLPSWTKTSMKTAMFAVLILFSLALLLSIIAVFRNNFSCSTCIFFGLCSGASSFGGCFFWPMFFFVVAAIPVAIAGAIVGIIIDMILHFVRKSKKK